MTKLEVGESTPYKDKKGKTIKIGDTVELEGHEFEVIQNDFTNEIVIDGDTGQEELRKVAYMCEVNIFQRFVCKTPFSKAIDISLSSKYKNSDDVTRSLWELRNKFAAKYGLRVMPNAVYLGENLVTILLDHSGRSSELPTVFGLKIVEVRETDHMSLGLTLQKH